MKNNLISCFNGCVRTGLTMLSWDWSSISRDWSCPRDFLHLRRCWLQRHPRWSPPPYWEPRTGRGRRTKQTSEHVQGLFVFLFNSQFPSSSPWPGTTNPGLCGSWRRRRRSALWSPPWPWSGLPEERRPPPRSPGRSSESALTSGPCRSVKKVKCVCVCLSFYSSFGSIPSLWGHLVWSSQSQRAVWGLPLVQGFPGEEHLTLKRSNRVTVQCQVQRLKKNVKL